MHDELTREDIKKLKEELDHRTKVLRPEIIEEVKRTRAFGDLSENFEYKAAKQEKNRNDSRIRYLEKMISTAKIIKDNAGSDTIGLYDFITLYMPEDDEEEVVRIVTTVRVDPTSGYISKESPLGKELLGRREGDKVTVKVSESYSYDAIVRSIKKAEDDGSAPLLRY